MLTRRRFLTAFSALSVSALGLACSNDTARLAGFGPADEIRTGSPPTEAPTATPTPEPVILPAGRQREALLAGTPYDTPLYIFGTGRPGPVVLILGGVHGNEPGGWLAADRLVDSLSFQQGSAFVVPHANKLAM